MWGGQRGGGERKKNLAEPAHLAAALLKLFSNSLQAVPTLTSPKLAAGLSIMPMQLFVQPDYKPYQRTDLADAAFAPPQPHD